ncbi:MAG: c-type cytochrome domain-containing protein, partial [Planctomycetota bacterium]|nr:c-type cytochrome domain-containing protein [Planctomycetota bacterium]
MTRVLHQPVLLAVAIVSQAIPLAANDKLAFFESKIRPALVEHCYECHSENADSIGGKLLLDTREGILRGGESGTAVIAGNPASSLILQAIRHDGIEMPPDTRLPETVVKDFERWIQDGA